MDELTEKGSEYSPSAPPEVLIFGSGACARKIAANLAGGGINAWLATGNDAPVETGSHGDLQWLANTELDRCRGFAGNFELDLKNRQRMVTKAVPAIVLAEDYAHDPNHASYGLQDGPRVMDISALEARLQRTENENPFNAAECVVFLCGLQRDSHPSVAKRMLDSCYHLQNRPGIRTYFLTGNLKVAETGAETRVQEAKRSGTMFLKFTDTYPSFESIADNRFEITYVDELTRNPFQLHADWIVVDERIAPGQNLAVLAKKLGIDKDGAGFAQSDNVRRMSNATNRRGIFVAGGGRGIESVAGQMEDADQVSLNVMAFLAGFTGETLPKVAIQRGRCARCLTCHRICPHVAIAIGRRVSIVTEACQSCGICVAACPARAIEMEGLQVDVEISRQYEQAEPSADALVSAPQIMVFGCARSAGQARSLMHLRGQALPAGVRFVEVPCGGTIAVSDLLAAFEAGADAVMLCPCHTDNCQSEIGNRVARKRAASVEAELVSAGLEKRCLRVSPVAANMGAEFAAMIEEFVSEITALSES